MALAKCLLSHQMKNLFTKRASLIRQPIKQTNCLFSTSVKKNAIPPLLWIIFKPVTKLGAILVGRGFRKWWTGLPQVKRTIFLDHLKRNKLRYAILVSTSTVGSVVYYQAHVQETPITHRQRFILFSSSHLSEIENLEKDQVII